MDHWNRLIKARNANANNDVGREASMLLRQLNTAGAGEIMKDEIEAFLSRNNI